MPLKKNDPIPPKLWAMLPPMFRLMQLARKSVVIDDEGHPIMGDDQTLATALSDAAAIVEDELGPGALAG